jgi:hypothetical protein
MSNTQKIYQAFQAGLESEEIIGYHGTSLETVKHILRTGKQLGSDFSYISEEIDKCVRLGDIFFFPIENTGIPSNLEECCSPEPEALKGAERYARAVSFFHKAYELLDQSRISRDSSMDGDSENTLMEGLYQFKDYYSIGMKERNMMDEMKNFIGHIKNKGLCPDKFYDECSSAPSVVLGYKESVLIEPLPGNGGNDIRVLDVSIDDIIGIEAQDEVAKEFFDI